MIKLYWLSQLELRDRPVVGEKVWMLSQLKQSGYPVFPGFVISSAIFRQFLENLNDVSSLLADFPTSSLHLDVDNPRALQLVAQQSRQSILSAPFPAEWQDVLDDAREMLQSSSLILRSSLGGPFLPNQDVSGITPAQVCWNDSQQVELGIKQIWGQLLSAKSLFYWQRLGLKIEQLNLGILVQPMAQAIASGMVSDLGKSWEIRGSWGLGHSLVNGEILPDRLEIDPDNGAIIEQILGNKTRAYRLKSQPNSQETSESCLEAYLLSTEEQREYCLKQDDIQELFQLIERLRNLKIPWKFLEWIRLESTETRSSSLMITQLVPSVSKQLPSVINPAATKPLLPSQRKGIAAAPGLVQGVAYVLAEGSFPDPAQLARKILVTQKIHPFQLHLIKQASGIITEQGGITSHGAILARELGIPAVVGVSGIASWLRTGDSVLVDGNNGTIFLHSVDKISPNYDQHLLSKPTPKTLKYPISTRLMVNLSQASSLVKVMDFPVDGLGLLRSELMILDLCNSNALTEWIDNTGSSEIIQQLKEQIHQFAEIFAPKPIFYRTFDDKFSIDRDRRGVLGYQFDATLFRLELQALSEVYHRGYHNINLIFPFVRTVEEFTFCRHLAEEFNLIPSNSLQFWIMAEVPAVIFNLPQYVKAGVQGIAIGTNDLIPLLLGIERDHLKLNEVTEPYFSTMLTALQHLIEQTKHLKIPCSICGQLVVQFPEIIELLIQWGVTTISVEPEGLERTYQAIARAEQRLILQLARKRS
ncbi:MAG: putative PEP-binding protein [Cyanobacteria bacterium P01_G01_bin.49]